MFHLRIKLLTIFILILLHINIAYSKTTSDDPNTILQESTPLLKNNMQQSSISHIDDMIKKKQVILLKTQKSDTTKYMSLYDDIVGLTIAKNKLLLELNLVDDIDTDRTCELAMNYAEVEFIKTQYYKTPFHDEVAKTLQNIATLYEQCHPPMAERYLKPILQIKEHTYGKESAEAANVHDKLGDHYRFSMAEFKNAIEHYEKAKDIREKLYGSKDPRGTVNYERLALSLYYHGDKMGKAEKLLLDSIDIRKNASPNKDFLLCVAYLDIGIHYSMKDEYAKSITYLQKALKVFQGEVNSNYIVILSELSQVYLNQDNLRNALKYGEEAYSVSKEFYGSDTHSQVLKNYNRLDEINDRINK